MQIAPVLRLHRSSTNFLNNFQRPVPFAAYRGRCATGVLSIAFAKHRAGESAGDRPELAPNGLSPKRGLRRDGGKATPSPDVHNKRGASFAATPESHQAQEESVTPSSAAKGLIRSGRKTGSGSKKRGERSLTGKPAKVSGRNSSAAKTSSSPYSRGNDEEGGMVPMNVLAEGETDPYLDLDTLDTMLRALTGDGGADFDEEEDADLAAELELDSAGKTPARRGRSALLDDVVAAASVGGFGADDGLAPRELLAGAPVGDDDSAAAEDLDLEAQDGLLELGAEDLGIDMEDAEGELEERGADEDEPPVRRLRGRQRVVKILAASRRGDYGGSSVDGGADPDGADPESFTAAEMEWLPNIYSGGRPKQPPLPTSLLLLGDEYRGEPMSTEGGAGVEGRTDGNSDVDELVSAGEVFADQVEHKLFGHDEPSPWRVQVVSVVTNSSRNSTALDCVNRVYDFLRAGTANDPRVDYQTICLTEDEDTPFEELEDMVQMWLEGYNTYHLVDGAAMKEAWGGIMPDILLSPRNLQAILDRVLWALEEDGMDGALLTPRLRRLRFRGGAQEMSTGFNTEHLESEFSVVSVR